MKRRQVLKNLSLLATSAFLSPQMTAFAQSMQNKTLVLVSGWQMHNIGDIAHTPGLLRLLELFLPSTKVILWHHRPQRMVDEMLMKNFPDLTILKEPSISGDPGEKTKDILLSADFLLHGSGPGIVGWNQVQWWMENAEKPYGIYGVTIGSVNEGTKKIIDNAAFVFTRETKSLEVLEQNNTRCKIQDFGPDATFAMDLHNEILGVQFLNQKALQPKEFICVVPRLRKTPYYDLYPEWGWEQDRIDELDQLNDQFKEKDHAKARQAIITWVRQTGKKVLVCPEMTYQLDIMKELLFDPLPMDVKGNVVMRDTYWLCDEAATVFKNAFAVISFECHSPIIACYNGTPAFYLRQPEDTIKGHMWYDVNLSDWVFEIEQTTGNEIAEKLMEIYDNPEKAQMYLENAMEKVRNTQYNNLTTIRKIFR